MPLTLIEEMDQKPRVEAFLRNARVQTLSHEDNRLKMAQLARDLGYDLDQVSSYIWIQCYIKELIGSFEDVPEACVIAQQFGIDFDEFQEYIGRREVALASSLGCNGSLLFLQEEYDAAAEEEMLQATSHGMTVQEWRDYIEDLQQDANLQG
jgi:hypothetical protein